MNLMLFPIPIRIVLFLLLILSVQKVDAQYNSTRYRLGTYISPTISWMATNDNKIDGKGSILGLKIGLAGEYYFHKSYAFCGGLNLWYGQGGGLQPQHPGNFWVQVTSLPDSLRLGATPIAAGSELRYKLRYLEIPFSLKLRTRNFGYWRYFAELPVFHLGFLLRARGDLDAPNVSLDNENIRQAVKGINFTWGGGGGLEYEISDRSAVSFGLYFQQGLSDITLNTNALIKPSGSTNAVEEDSKAYTNSLVLRVMMLF